jgi:hypothetical protein
MQQGGKYTHADLARVQKIFKKYNIPLETVILGKGANYKQVVLKIVHPDKRQNESEINERTEEITYLIDFPAYAADHYMKALDEKLTVRDVLEMKPGKADTKTKADPKIKKTLEDMQENIFSTCMNNPIAGITVINICMLLLKYITLIILSNPDKKIKKIISAQAIAHVFVALGILENIKNVILANNAKPASQSKSSSSRSKSKSSSRSSRQSAGTKKRTKAQKAKSQKAKALHTKTRKNKNKRKNFQGGVGGDPEEKITYARLFAKTKKTYDAKNDDELSFDAGEEIEITNKHPKGHEGMWEGKYQNKTGLFPNNYVEEIVKWGYGRDSRYPEMEGDVEQFVKHLINADTNCPETKQFQNLVYKYLQNSLIDSHEVIRTLGIESLNEDMMMADAFGKKKDIQMNFNEDQKNRMERLTAALNVAKDLNLSENIITDQCKLVRKRLEEVTHRQVKNIVFNVADRGTKWKSGLPTLMDSLKSEFKIPELKNNIWSKMFMTSFFGVSGYMQYTMWGNNKLGSADVCRSFTDPVAQYLMSQYSAQGETAFPRRSEATFPTSNLYESCMSQKWMWNDDKMENIWPIVQYALLFGTISYFIAARPSATVTGIGALAISSLVGLITPMYRAACGVGLAEYCTEPPNMSAMAGEFSDMGSFGFSGVDIKWGSVLDNFQMAIWNYFILPVGNFIASTILKSGDGIVAALCVAMIFYALYYLFHSSVGMYTAKTKMKNKFEQLRDAAAFNMADLETVVADFQYNGPPGGSKSKAYTDAIKTLHKTALQVKEENMAWANAQINLTKTDMQGQALDIQRGTYDLTLAQAAAAQSTTAQEEAQYTREERDEIAADLLRLSMPNVPGARSVSLSPQKSQESNKDYELRQSVKNAKKNTMMSTIKPRGRPSAALTKKSTTKPTLA